MNQKIQITILDNGYLLEHSTGAAPVRKMAFESLDTLFETLGDIFDAEVTVKGEGKSTGKLENLPRPEHDAFGRLRANLPMQTCTNAWCWPRLQQGSFPVSECVGCEHLKEISK